MSIGETASRQWERLAYRSMPRYEARSPQARDFVKALAGAAAYDAAKVMGADHDASMRAVRAVQRLAHHESGAVLNRTAGRSIGSGVFQYNVGANDRARTGGDAEKLYELTGIEIPEAWYEDVDFMVGPGQILGPARFYAALAYATELHGPDDLLGWMDSVSDAEFREAGVAPPQGAALLRPDEKAAVGVVLYHGGPAYWKSYMVGRKRARNVAGLLRRMEKAYNRRHWSADPYLHG